MNAPMPITGRCLCGTVELRVEQYDPHVRACHCSMCRKWTGAAYFMFTAPSGAVQIKGAVREYQSSDITKRASCEICGSHLWMRDEASEYELMPGLFPEAASFPLITEVYADQNLTAINLTGDHQRTSRAQYHATNRHV